MKKMVKNEKPKITHSQDLELNYNVQSNLDKKKIMNFLIDKNIEFSQPNSKPKNYQAVIQLYNLPKPESKSKSPKPKELKELKDIKQNKQKISEPVKQVKIQEIPTKITTKTNTKKKIISNNKNNNEQKKSNIFLKEITKSMENSKEIKKNELMIENKKPLTQIENSSMRILEKNKDILSKIIKSNNSVIEFEAKGKENSEERSKIKKKMLFN